MVKQIFNSFLPFSDFLYILQLEEYSTKRLIRWLPKFFFKRNIQRRQKLIWTKRVKITFSLAFLLFLLYLLFVVAISANSPILFFLLPAVFLLTPIYVLIANWLITPYFENIKSKIRARARVKVSGMKDLKIVLVAGSFGKTSVKNFVYQMSRYSQKTQMIPGNINTPAGIANWVNNSLDSNTKLLIAEVDAYEIGEISKSCEVLQADISLITNIADQHLERFGSQQKLAQALSEVFVYSKPDATLLCTAQTRELLSQALQNDARISTEFTYLEKYKHDISELSASNQINIKFALEIAGLLKVEERFIFDALKNLELPDRRQRKSEIFGFSGIDDSYNISFTTAIAGLSEARRIADFEHKKLLVISAGIPELSHENKDKNNILGFEISKTSDFCIILGSDFADELASGFKDSDRFKILPDLNVAMHFIKENYSASEWFIPPTA